VFPVDSAGHMLVCSCAGWTSADQRTSASSICFDNRTSCRLYRCRTPATQRPTARCSRCFSHSTQLRPACSSASQRRTRAAPSGATPWRTTSRRQRRRAMRTTGRVRTICRRTRVQRACRHQLLLARRAPLAARHGHMMQTPWAACIMIACILGIVRGIALWECE
jgi:hypothetical protein